MDKIKLINPKTLKILLDVLVDNGEIHTMQDIKDFIDAMPNAAPKPRRGTWQPEDPDDDIWYRCSCCGMRISTDWDFDDPESFAYCPMCGAKMKGGL